MEEDNHDSYESMEDESQEDYESMEEDSHDSYEELEDEILESNAAMEVDSVGDHSSIEDWEPRSDNLPLMDDEDSNNTNSNVWVYAKHLQTPGAFQQVCLGQWAPNELEESKESDGSRRLAHTDVVLGKGSYISLCRFTEYEADYPSGSWESIHEQHVFGTIKDLKSVSIDFEDEEYDLDQETAASCYNKRPRMGYLPELASKSLLVATSDNGFLTFLAFHYDTERQKPEDRGHFYAVKKIDIAEPGHDFSEMGAKIALDPTSNMMAVSGIQGHVKLFFLRKTKRSSFDPIEMISSVEVEGTIIAMDFLYVDRNATLVTAILGVLYFNKASGKHYISTFHIGPSHLNQEPPIYVGTSEIGSSHLLSVLLLKGLPDLPYCMVYVDEESITYVTTEQLTAPSGTTTINHTHHKPLKLLKKESRVDRGTKDDADDPKDTYPLISACATPPRSSSLDGQQTLYLGSDSADFFRVNINGHNNTMYFELDAGDRPIGRVLEVIGGSRSIVHQRTEQGPNQPLHTDFLLYSSEHGNGNILGVKEEEEGDKYEWTPADGVLTSASWAKEGTLVLGKISTGGYSLIVLELARNSDDSKAKAKARVASASHSFRVITLKSVNAEPTTIYCWTESSPVQSATDLGDVSTEVLCCVGTLEPAIYLFRIRQENIEEVYTESLAQRREDVAVPHSIAVLKNEEGLQRILVGLRNGSIVVYEWNQLRHPDHLHSSPSIPGRTMSLPRLFNLGIMPVKFAYSDEPLLSRTLILSDKIWQANFDNEFEVQPILFDNEVSEACAFESQDSGYLTRPGFVCIVDHQDLQLLTLKGKRKYDSQSLPLGHTPRRLLDVTSEGLLLAASVGDGFPFAESVLQLIDPKRVSNEPGPETQHVVAELSIKQGEGVFCLAEWKLPNKVLICVGTGIFSPTGAAASAASPRTGRLIILSIRHSKSRGYGLVEEWAMDMSLPVFAISPFFDNKILVSTGPVLKLFAISSSESSLVEKANARERWPIVQISSQGKMIVTGSRGESINFYEYEAGNGEHSFDKLKFFKSARSARQVSDCLAISPELAVGVDLSGSVFGVGYTPGVVDRQYSLVDQFSFQVGEIVSRIRLAKLWKDDGRSLAGIPLPRSVLQDTVSSTSIALTRLPSFVSLLRPFILIPWSPFDSDEPSTDIATPTTKTARPSSQALIGFSIVGSILGFWRLAPQLYDILKALQQAMATFYDSRPVLGPSHGAYRSQNQPTKGFHTIDGNLIDRFLALDHAVQIEVVDCAIRLEGMIEEWIRNCDVDSDVAGSGGGGGDAVLRAALEREFRTTICSDDCATGRKCVDHANLRRSLYLNDKGRPIDADRLEGDDDGDEGSSWRQEGNGRPVDVIGVPCRAIHVLCSVLRFLRSLDWHQ
ncbi:hypothetical protein BGZ91_011026 [Linnemannia elongata]|nr:hypothetical protein BGZ91_011026 [Linnemannia elongata]